MEIADTHRNRQPDRHAAARAIPGELAYLGLGRSELALNTAAGARLLLLGGVPFEAPIVMWWNFVARTRDELDLAQREWNDPDPANPRFGEAGGRLTRIPAPPTPWAR